MNFVHDNNIAGSYSVQKKSFYVVCTNEIIMYLCMNLVVQNGKHLIVM